MNYFTADHHFGHKNIIPHADRPFDSVHDMNVGLVKAWNAVVKKNDTVYHLGDICWGSAGPMRAILERLNGTIHLVTGNHDKTALNLICSTRFASIGPLKEITVSDPDAPRGKRHIVLCHYAMRTWNKSHYGAWQLYGHSHGKLPELEDKLSMDVGVDTFTIPFGTPYAYTDIKAIMATRTWEPPFAPRGEK